MPNALPVTRAKTAYTLLSKIIQVILEEPARIAMNLVCMRGVGLVYALKANDLHTAPPCGAVGCVAGWTLMLTGNTKENERNGSSTYDARVILGLSYEQERELFFPHELTYNGEQQSVKHANEVADHIRLFQNTHAAQLKATPISYPKRSK